MRKAPLLVVGLAAGCVTAVVIALAGTVMARSLWPAYAAAEPDKAYSFAMLVSRLLVGAICTIGAACVASIIVRDDGRAACWLGALFLAISLPGHLYHVWADYPAWYHVLYLSYLVPLAALTGRAFYNCFGHNVRHPNSRPKADSPKPTK